MEHEDFPTPGFEFMNEPATEEQKDIFCAYAKKLGDNVKRNGAWPEPFSKWDAARAIDILRQRLLARGIDPDKQSENATPG